MIAAADIGGHTLTVGTAENGAGVEYITRADLDAVCAKIEDLRAELDGLSIRRPTKKKECDE